MATGEPGSGKSAFLAAIALGLRASGEWYVLFGDGDPAGGSSPLLNQLAHWPAAGPEQALTQLEALEAEVVVRSLLKSTLTLGPDGRTPTPITDPASQVPLSEMLPCPDYPGIQWIIDELHRLTQDDWLKGHHFAGRLEQLVRIGRKYGIVVLTGSQSLLADDYGANTKLRAYLGARNCFAFRNGNKTEQHVVAGLTIAPAALPPGGGYAFATGTGRVSMLRAAWSRDMGRHAAELPTVWLDPDSALALAPYLPEADRDPATVYAAATERLRAWRTGQQPPPTAGPGAGPTGVPGTGPGGGPVRTGTGPVQPTSGFTGNLDTVVIPAALTGANVVPIRASQPGPDHRPEPPATGPNSPDLDRLTGTQRTVHDALTSLGRRQVARTGQLADLTGLRPPAVSKALSVLEEHGLAVKLAHGEWRGTAGHVTGGNGAANVDEEEVG
jgi:hypothetical protein